MVKQGVAVVVETVYQSYLCLTSVAQQTHAINNNNNNNNNTKVIFLGSNFFRT